MKLLLILGLFLLLVIIGLLYYAANFLFKGILDRQDTWFDDVAHSLVNTDIDAEHDSAITEREAFQLATGTAFWETSTEHHHLKSFDGLTLHGRVFYSETDSDKWVLCFHGYRTSGLIDMGYIASRLVTAGYNCLIVDQRAHGESEGRFITMGWLERRDVLTWTDYIINQKKPGKVFLMGDSMGAATVLMASGEVLPPEVQGIVADCGYTSIKDLFNYLLGSAFKVPTWVPIVGMFSLITRARLKFNIYDASAEKQLQKNKLPILFIHGDADTFVPLAMSKRNQAATQGPNDLVIVKEAPHFSSILFDPELYLTSVVSFLNSQK
ncbi:alpha/beta hydrolase [Vagococcus salmoninarum]|uniref:Serine aminopeptidase S33 domain-containing protein n=1 Tax=Vagococcus salmoninarum TaxID=2739 RepID=A0A429ZP36_9ENTE|nr:alpha/beta fold hydrolase [Vagococcus salmoninarum]RST95436.1 hypothetical protein CBF35_07710 [Vagococcus salmoninarum]